MADDDGFVTAYATPSVRVVVGVELTQQEQAIWNGAFGAHWAFGGTAERSMVTADNAVIEFRKLQAGPRANLGKVV